MMPRKFLVTNTVERRQLVEADSEQEAVELAAANPEGWEYGEDDYDVVEAEEEDA